MKNILFFLLFIPILSYAQPVAGTLSEIAGKWQEVSRSGKKNKQLSFEDTLKLEIRGDGFMLARYHKGATIIGEAELNGNRLKFEKSDFEVVEAGPEHLVLNDKQGNHHFVKIPEFTSSPVARILPGVEQGKINLSSETLKGKWTIYKKTDPDFTSATFYLKSLDVKEDKGNQTYQCTATFNNNDSVYATEATLQVIASEMLLSGKSEKIKLNVLKSDGNELILQHGAIHYFLKQFGSKK
jgi:hypothetical protein